jgi:hypothetical protein
MSATTMNAPNTIRLPPLETLWPWPRVVNVHLPDVEQESFDWCFRFGAFKPETQRVIYEQGNFSKLGHPKPSSSHPTQLVRARVPCGRS